VQPSYNGLPAASSVEQAIIQAQLLIRRDLERCAERIREQSEEVKETLRAA
jgi:hypothetical protein